MEGQAKELQTMAQSIENLQKQQEVIMQILVGLQRQVQGVKPSGYTEAAENNGNTAFGDVVPYQMRTPLMSAKRVSEAQLFEGENAQRAAQIIEMSAVHREAYHEAKKIALYMHELKSTHFVLEKERVMLQGEYERDRIEIPKLSSRAESMEEHLENIDVLRGRVLELRAQREGLHFWEFWRKRELDRQIEQAEADVRVAEHSFNSKFHVSPVGASLELKRIKKELGLKESGLAEKKARMVEIVRDLEVLEVEYHAQKLRNESRPDRELISKLLRQLEVAPLSVRDGLRQVRVGRSLEAIGEGTKKVIEKLHQNENSADNV